MEKLWLQTPLTEATDYSKWSASLFGRHTCGCHSLRYQLNKKLAWAGGGFRADVDALGKRKISRSYRESKPVPLFLAPSLVATPTVLLWQLLRKRLSYVQPRLLCMTFWKPYVRATVKVECVCMCVQTRSYSLTLFFTESRGKLNRTLIKPHALPL